jgi:hypothetical protein
MIFIKELCRNCYVRPYQCCYLTHAPMPDDEMHPDPDKAVQAELADLVERTLADERVKNGVIDRLQKISERPLRWTPLPEKPEEPE